MTYLARLNIAYWRDPPIKNQIERKFSCDIFYYWYLPHPLTCPYDRYRHLLLPKPSPLPTSTVIAIDRRRHRIFYRYRCHHRRSQAHLPLPAPPPSVIATDTTAIAYYRQRHQPAPPLTAVHHHRHSLPTPPIFVIPCQPVMAATSMTRSYPRILAETSQN